MPLKYQLQGITTKNVLVLPHDFEPSEVRMDCDLLIIDYASSYDRNDCELDLVNRYRAMGIEVPWVLITSNFNYHHSVIPEIIYYPVHLIQCIIDNKDSHVDIQSKRNFAVGFVNGNLHYVRIMLVLEMFKYGWFSKCKINFPDVNLLDGWQRDTYQQTVSDMNNAEKELLCEFVKILPLQADASERLDVDGLTFAYLLNGNAGFVDCYVNTMVESEWNLPYITEKSIKPFLSGQFNAVLANVGVYSHLEELGFDMMNSYIDLRTQGDIRQSLSDMFRQIDSLLIDIETAWEETYHRRLANYQLAKSGALLNMLQKKLFEIITEK